MPKAIPNVLLGLLEVGLLTLTEMCARARHGGGRVNVTNRPCYYLAYSFTLGMFLDA